MQPVSRVGQSLPPDVRTLGLTHDGRFPKSPIGRATRFSIGLEGLGVRRLPGLATLSPRRRGALGQSETLPIVVWDEILVCREKATVVHAASATLLRLRRERQAKRRTKPPARGLAHACELCGLNLGPASAFGTRQAALEFAKHNLRSFGKKRVIVIRPDAVGIQVVD